MRKLMYGMFLSVALMVLTGCSGVSGMWVMDSIEPESAKDQFPMSALCLHKDGTYAATMACGTKFTGTYTYDADAKQLAFKGDTGKECVYKACLCKKTDKLFVESTDETKGWVAAMKRGKCACKCDGKCTCGDADKKACCGSAKCEPEKCKGDTK